MCICVISHVTDMYIHPHGIHIIHHRYLHTSTLYMVIFFLPYNLSHIRSELMRTSHCVNCKLKPV